MKLCQRCSNCYDDSEFICPSDGQVLDLTWPDSRMIANKYQLESVVARGGMGVVYRARQLELNREVAVKILSPQLTSKERMVKQFHREALAVARIDHINIVPIYDYGTLKGGGAYLVMKLVNGRQLTQEIYDSALSIERTIRILEQVCEGVAVAHANQVVHCDLKPDNILMEKVGNRELVQLVDFGISKLREMSTDGSLHSAITESAIGTPQYMSPEQCCGEPITHHTDIYSLGIIAFEMLTGRVPFRSQFPAEIAKNHVRTPPPRPSSFNPIIPSEIDDVIIKALAKTPGERQDSVREFFQELREASGINLDLAMAAPAAATGQLPFIRQDTVKAQLLEDRLSEALEPQPLTHTELPLVTMSGLHCTNPYFEPIDKAQLDTNEKGERLSVLLADQDPSLFQAMIKDLDCHLIIAKDGKTAWDLLSEKKIALVICNVSLPIQDGWQLFSQSQLLPFAPVFIFISNDDNDEDRLRALEEGVEDYWPQPYAAAELQIRLKRLLQRLQTELHQQTLQSIDSLTTDFEEHFSIGVAYMEYGLYQDAIDELSQALTSLGDTPNGKYYFRCCYELGRCHQELQHKHDAYEWYCHALAVPGYSEEDYHNVQAVIADLMK